MVEMAQVSFIFSFLIFTNNVTSLLIRSMQLFTLDHAWGGNYMMFGEYI
jgi:hypothetical protein